MQTALVRRVNDSTAGNGWQNVLMSAQVPPNSPAANPAGFSARGAVDLAALAQAREQQKLAQERAEQRAANPEAFAATAGSIVDVTVADFQAEVIDRSFEVPVVVDLWAPSSPGSQQLSPILEKLAQEGAGKWVLAKVNVEAEPSIGQAFQVQAIPTVIALIKGQPVPLFQTPMPEAQIRQIIDELINVAAENGVAGVESATADTDPDESDEADEAADASTQEPADDPGFDVAFDAFEAGDWDAVEAAYKDILTRLPADPDATAGLTRVALMRRTTGHDQSEALAAADADPTDVTAAILAADFTLQGGDAQGGFSRLIATVKVTSGDERKAAREHLVSLFELVGNQDPDVAAARTALANALY